LDRERNAGGLSEDELIERVHAQSLTPTERAEALKQLVRRRSPRETQVLTAIVGERKAPRELRSTAAVVLGKRAAPEHQRALISALYEDDRDVVRRAAEALGRIGDREALSWIEKLPYEPAGAAGRAVSFARSLISYRLGLGSHRLKPPPERVLPIHPDRRTQLRMSPASPEKVRKREPSLRRELPGIDVDLESAIEMTCAGNDYLALLHRDLSRVSREDAIPLTVLKYYSSGDYAVYLYVFTHPESGGTLQVFGVRPTGTLTHVGRARLSNGELVFSIGALDTTHSPGMELEGTVDINKKQLRLSRAWINSAPLPGQRRSQAPRPD
jgi:hypothetical protein